MDPMGLGIQNTFQESLSLFFERIFIQRELAMLRLMTFFGIVETWTLWKKVKCTSKENHGSLVESLWEWISRDSWMYPDPNIPLIGKSLQKRPFFYVGIYWFFSSPKNLLRPPAKLPWVHVGELLGFQSFFSWICLLLVIFYGLYHSTPRKLTWNPRMDPLNRRFLLGTSIFRFYVKFLGSQSASLPTNLGDYVLRFPGILSKSKHDLLECSHTWSL